MYVQICQNTYTILTHAPLVLIAYTNNAYTNNACVHSINWMTQNNETNGIEEQFFVPSDRDNSIEMNTSLRIDNVTLERLDDLAEESEGLSKAKIVNALVYAVWAAEIGGDDNQSDV